ncbi:MAG TPA: S8 family serine peptidase [Woeseiaceae bacterium]|nr:S8 family serine peptidase [Woeseiaceae bacterium]
MHRLSYYSHRRALAVSVEAGGRTLRDALVAPAARVGPLFAGFPELPLYVTRPAAGAPLAVPTETLVVEGAGAAEVDWACRRLSLEVIREGRHGRVLLRAVCDATGIGRLRHAADAARRLYRRGNVAVAHPNFLRLYRPPPASAETGVALAEGQWALDNDGDVGVAGADVGAEAAWALTTGQRRVRVAILDDGIDLAHPYLRPAAAAERDFVADDRYGRPAGDDAHGTAVAGIVAADGPRATGLAPGVSLVAARIARGGAHGYWLSDDFDTAEAVDWCAGESRADILNLSWGGGPPADAITGALERAARTGRRGRGCLIVAAAGNSQSGLDYPATLPVVLAVGASNPWDRRKTRRSRDGEHWWGSSHGLNLSLLAPGVSILTTDLRGRRGFSPTLVYDAFSGTSAAAPFVSAAAALVLSLRPELPAARLRRMLEESAVPLDGGRRSTHGHGRLDAAAALRLAAAGAGE